MALIDRPLESAMIGFSGEYRVILLAKFGGWTW